MLRHVVEKVSYLRINVPHNDSEISSLAPCCGRGLGRGGEKKAAFTLAEVLITLGIIGIVAAMTIPTLITRYQKREVATKLKATYSTIANALKLAEEEMGI